MVTDLQDALVDHYTHSSGLITNVDVGITVCEKWVGLIENLFANAKDLYKLDWSNPDELRLITRDHDIWELIHEMYDLIGLVNGQPLQKKSNIVAIFVSYANINDNKQMTSFRSKVENFLAREVIVQRSKTDRLVKDELSDRKAIRKLRRRRTDKSDSTDEYDKQEIDFSRITVEAKKKIFSITQHPHDYESYIDTIDQDLIKKFLLHYFKRIDNELYLQAWSRFLNGLGITATNHGIDVLVQRVDKRMGNSMYEMLIQRPVIGPEALIRMLFCEELFKTIKEELEANTHSRQNSDSTWNENSILYVYKGRTKCHSRNHIIVSATAILTGRYNADIKLNVEYCVQCNKFYISYTVYESYRERYGMLLGRLQMDNCATGAYGDYILSELSPLRLNGYSVSQQDGYSSSERQYILATVILKNAMSKKDVIRYLEYFINMNGQRVGNEKALIKWKEDLDFVLNFNMQEQDKYRIAGIERYKNNKNRTQAWVRFL